MRKKNESKQHTPTKHKNHPRTPTTTKKTHIRHQNPPHPHTKNRTTQKRRTTPTKTNRSTKIMLEREAEIIKHNGCCYRHHCIKDETKCCYLVRNNCIITEKPFINLKK